MSGTTCPVQCECHTGPYAACSVPGGCGSEGCGRDVRPTRPVRRQTEHTAPQYERDTAPPEPAPDPDLCRNGDRCLGYDRSTKQPAERGATAVCDPCLDWDTERARRAVNTLPWRVLDLAQLQAPSMAQTLTGQPGGRTEPPMPLAAAPEALQAQIVHVLTTWEQVIRDVCGLSDIPAATNQPWHTTVTRRPPSAVGRLGAQARRAAGILAPRMDRLARLGPTAVYPTGCEDDPTDLDGVDALHALDRLDRLAFAMLGRTRREFWVPGECWQDKCAKAHQKAVKDGHDRSQWLYRAEPARAGDEPPVHCRYCDEPRTYAEYLAYVEMMVWPTEHDAPKERDEHREAA